MTDLDLDLPCHPPPPDLLAWLQPTVLLHGVFDLRRRGEGPGLGLQRRGATPVVRAQRRDAAVRGRLSPPPLPQVRSCHAPSSWRRRCCKDVMGMYCSG
uniref:Uncharacterized protein n=1 Tax=Arundo donax TaxID=35708 RepID=A0A0A9E960_ARUDO